MITLAAILTLFGYAEKCVKPEVRSAVSNWLGNIPLEGFLNNWSTHFGEVFDGIFGKRHLTWRCFWRSCLASIFAFIVAIVILPFTGTVKILMPPLPSDLIYSSKVISSVAFFILFLGCNLIPDYLSLLETRYIIRWIGKKYSISRATILLLFDLLLTGIIWLIWSDLIVTVLYFCFKGELPWYFVRFLLVSFWAVLRWLFFGSIVPRDDIYWILAKTMFYSAFFTSAWVWLYVSSGIVVKLVNRIGIGLRMFTSILNIREHPIMSLGLIACVLITILFLVGLGLALV